MFKELDINQDKVQDFVTIFKKWSEATDWVDEQTRMSKILDTDTKKRDHLLGLKMEELFQCLDQPSRRASLTQLGDVGQFLVDIMDSVGGEVLIDR